MAERTDEDEAVRRGHELGDVSPRKVFVFYGALALVIAGALVVAQLPGAEQTMFAPVSGGPPQRVVPPQPRLQASPGAELEALRQQQRARFDSYGWVEATQGIARIPVARAMELVVERGLPAREAGDAR